MLFSHKHVCHTKRFNLVVSKRNLITTTQTLIGSGSIIMQIVGISQNSISENYTLPWFDSGFNRPIIAWLKIRLFYE